MRRVKRGADGVVGSAECVLRRAHDLAYSPDLQRSLKENASKRAPEIHDICGGHPLNMPAK